MDLNYLKDSVANLSLYDIKAGVRKVQNGMLGVAESGRQWLAEIANTHAYSRHELYGDGGKGMLRYRHSTSATID